MPNPWELDFSNKPQAAAPKSAPWEMDFSSATEEKESGFGRALKTLDSYTGGPIRAGISAAQQGKGLGGFLDAGAAKLGEPDVEVPSMKQIMETAGVSGKNISDFIPGAYASEEESKNFFRLKPAKGGLLDPTISGAVALPAEIATDITTYAAAPIFKGAGKLTGAISETAPAKALSKGMGKISSGAAKVGETLTGIPKKDIQTFASKSDEILNEAKKFEGNIQEATDATRAKWAKQVSEKRRAINNELSSKLDANYSGVAADTSPVIESLERAKSKMDPVYDKDSIAQIQDKINEIESAGAHSVSRLYALKQDLAEVAKGSFKKGGQIFSPGSKFQKAAKEASGVANATLLEVAPDVKKIDSTLSSLRKIEERLNKNVLAEGKSEAAIVAAGSGANQATRKQLGLLSRIADADMIGDAERLSAMRSFSSPPIIPVDTTGKSFARMATGRGVAGLLGAGAGYEADGLTGAATGFAGGALASPIALKYSLMGANKLKKIPGLLNKLNTPESRKIISGFLSHEKASKE